MKTQKNKYNLRQQSPVKAAGIQIFQNKKNKRFYFHINDISGHAILYSQAYTATKGRDNGLKSILKNRTEDNRYLIKPVKAGSHHFVIRAGNNQEIARSRDFPSLAELKKQISYLKNADFIYDAKTANLPKKQAQTKKANVMAFDNIKKADNTPSKRKPSLKHAFRIDVYQDEKGVLGAGKIEHLLSQKKAAFQGLDFDKIKNFIQLHTGFNATKNNQIKTKSKPKIPSFEAPKETIKEMFITEVESSGHKNQVGKNDKFNINMELSKQYISSTQTPFSIKLWATSLSTGKNFILDKKQAILSKNAELLRFPIDSSTLSPGIYRIKSSLTLQTKGQKTRNPLAGDCILRIY